MNAEQDNQLINPTYEEGDFVVYPAHGVGYVLGIEKVEISGVLQDYLNSMDNKSICPIIYDQW